jgi:hypothetical protein
VGSALVTEDLLARIADLERRIRNLETSPRLTQSSVKDGAVTFYDAATRRVVVIGKQPDTGKWGISVFDALTGNRVVYLGEYGTNLYGMFVDRTPGDGVIEANTSDGIISPWLTHPFRRLNDFVAVTSGTFVSTHEAAVELIQSKAARVRIPWTTDGGTTGEVRLFLNGSATNARSLAAGGAGEAEFKWLHGATLGSGPQFFQIQARRTGGAGNVDIYMPLGLTVGSNFDETATGI